MFPREHNAGNNSSNTVLASEGNGRRAFRDVTNSSNNHEAPIPLKRTSNFVLPRRSVVSISSETSVTVTHRFHKQNTCVSSDSVNPTNRGRTNNHSSHNNDHSSRAIHPRQHSSNVSSRQHSSNTSSRRQTSNVSSRRQTSNVSSRQQSKSSNVSSRQKNSSSNVSSCQKCSNSSSFASIKSSSYQYSAPVDDIDERNADDPLSATEYVQEMYEHFRAKELKTSVRPVYMENQPHINARMRSILIDWLVEVHLKFKLVPETLHLTVNLIDRYLEKKEVSRPKLQLVGVTCLLIASKYEEIYPPEITDLVYICDRAYSKKDIFDMEETILRALEYKVTIPSAHAFLVRFLKAAHADRKMVQLSCYILDGSLQSYNLLHYLPSQLAAAAVLIARRHTGRNSWSPTLLKYIKYCEEEVIPVARAVLAEKLAASLELCAIDKKYGSSRYGGVSNNVFTGDF